MQQWFIQPSTKRTSYKSALKTLKDYMKAKDYSLRYVNGFIDWQFWDYTESPFWSVTCSITCRGKAKELGFHIHVNGEVVEIEL